MIEKRKKSVAVTGGAGFIGSHIVEEFLAHGYNVTVVDNLHTGSLKNLQPFGRHISFIKGSILDRATLQRVFRGVAYVLHQAAIVSVQESIRDPIKTHRTNVIGALNVFWAARVCGVKRVVYASSSAVYGENTSPPIREDTPLSPATPYALQKATVESYARIYATLYNMETVGLRYFNVFGPRQDPSSPYAAVIPLFIHAIQHHIPPTIYGDGFQTRDFVYVKDVARANLLACTANHVSGQVFNIASGVSITMNDLFARITQLLKRKITPRYEPARAGDIMHSSAECTKAKRLLGFTDGTDFDTGLEQTVRLTYKQSY